MNLEPLSSRIAVVGTGVIGASWAAYFLAKGFDVAATDPAEGAEKRLRALVDVFWPALESMGHRVSEAASGGHALRLLQGERFDVAFLDLRLGREEGMEQLPGLLRAAPEMAVT